LPQGDFVTVHAELIVRDDALTLFGFVESVERDWFRLLITVQGIGPRVALNILSTLSPTELAAAIASGSRATLGRAQGVGARLAARLASELRDRAAALPTSDVAESTSVAMAQTDDDARAAASALVNLGYRRADVVEVIDRLRQAADQPMAFDALVRAALREIAR
jgi:Holliday junction DNA helicase RuvA